MSEGTFNLAIPAVQRSRWRWVGVALRVLSVIAVVGIVLFFGVGQFREKLAIAKPITFVGHSDESAYASMGRSLVEGHGLQVNYVSFYFIPYGREITRREDHWPPFMGLMIAPCFYVWGQAAWVAKLPAMMFGSVGLPLAAGLLAYALSRRGYVAIVAALLMMAHPYIYHESMKTLSDVALAMLLAGFAGCALLARRWQWMHLVAGVFIAAAYYAKGSQVMLLGLYPVMVLLGCGWRTFRRPWFYGGVGVAVVLMAPFWYSNYRLFGNPLHSTQNYVSGYYSFGGWEESTYFPYWGVDPPKTSDRWTKNADYVQHSREQLETLALTMLTGIEPPPDAWGDFGKYGYAARDLLNGEWSRRRDPFGHFAHAPVRAIEEWQLPPWELAAAAAVLLAGWMVIAWPVMQLMALGRWIYRRRGRASEMPLTPRAQDQGLAGPVAAVVLLIVVEALFLAFFWAIRTRFSFMFLPLIAALGCTGAAYFVERPVYALFALVRVLLRKRILRRPAWFRAARAAIPYWHVVLTIVFAGGLLLYSKPLEARYADWLDGQLDRSEYPFVDERVYPALGAWLHQNYPGAVVMARNPWDITFCDPGSKGITYPFPAEEDAKGATQILAIARYYHVTHLFVDSGQGALRQYLSGQLPGVKRVHFAPGPLYAIDWTKIPELTVEQALGRQPLPAATTTKIN
jgi:hypothetical protein